jgi:hypothetical protein
VGAGSEGVGMAGSGGGVEHRGSWLLAPRAEAQRAALEQLRRAMGLEQPHRWRLLAVVFVQRGFSTNKQISHTHTHTHTHTHIQDP